MYSPVYQPGEQCSFYANFKKPLTEDTSGWQIDIVDEAFNLIEQNISSIQKNFLSDTEYHFYAYFIMRYLDPGCYRFIIRKSSTNEVKFISNFFTVANEYELKKTVPVKYRGKGNISSFYYSTVPEYFNQFRLHLEIVTPDPEEVAQGFETSKGLFYRTLSILKETVNVITDYFDREAHRAMLSMCTHSTLIIDNESYQKGEGGAYDTNWPEKPYHESQAQITLEVRDYAEANNDC